MKWHTAPRKKDNNIHAQVKIAYRKKTEVDLPLKAKDFFS